MSNLFSTLNKIRIDIDGVEFPVYNDTLLWIWPWKKVRRSCGAVFFSRIYKSYFNTLPEYWYFLGQERAIISTSHKEKAYGYSLNTLVETFARVMYPGQIVVVLTNINSEAKGSTFWKQLPPEKMAVFKSDFAVLMCGSKNEAVRIVDNISEDFATAFVCNEDGVMFCNLWV